MKNLLKVMVRGTYQVQKLRIQMGNRIVGNFKVKLGQVPGQSEENLDEVDKKMLDVLRRDYKTIAEGVSRFPTAKKFKAHGIIDNYTELCLLEQYFNLEKSEEEHFKRIGQMLEDYPIWTQYLKDVKGIGPALAGVIISEIDIEKATYPSSLWKLAGLDVAWDNKGRSKRSEHLETVEYINKNGKKDTKQSITFKPFLKTKLMGVASSSFLRVGRSSPYAQAYYDYKTRLDHHVDHRDRFIALHVEKCMEQFGSLNFKIYRKKYITRHFDRCQQRVLELYPDMSDSELREETTKLMKKTLGKYELAEKLIEDDLAIGIYFDEDEIEIEVNRAGGVLRKPKEVTVEEETEDGSSEFKVVEQYDNSPDKKGKVLYRLINLGTTKNHKHQMACRYAIKRFLVALHANWRRIENLPVTEEYAVAKLGLVHGEASEGKITKDY